MKISSRVSAPPRAIQASSSSRSSATAFSARRSRIASSLTGGASSPYAARTIERASPRTAVEQVALFSEDVEDPERLAAELHRLVDDTDRVVDRTAAQPPLQVVDVSARETREGRAQEPVEVVPVASEPFEPQQREERLAEGGPPDPDSPFDRVRDADRAERRLDLAAVAIEVRAHEQDLLGGRAAPDQGERLLGDQLERPARARTLEKANRPVELRACRWLLGEEMALEVREGSRGDLVVAGRQLFDAACGERRQVVRRPAKRVECGTIRLVGERDRDLRAPGERLEQRPLGAGQVLEAVRKNRPALPGLELRGHALGCVAALQVAVPELEAIELGAVGPVQAGEVAFQVGRLDQAGLELAERAGQRIREAGEARRVPEPVERGCRDRGADDELPLGIGHHRPVGAAVAGEPLEEIVEGPDPAARGARRAWREARARSARRPTRRAR